MRTSSVRNGWTAHAVAGSETCSQTIGKNSITALPESGELTIAEGKQNGPIAKILLKFSEVSEALGLTRATIYKMIREGKFPQPRKLNQMCSRWLRSEVHEWMQQLPAGTAPKPRKAAA